MLSTKETAKCFCDRLSNEILVIIGAQGTAKQGSSLGLILTHNEAKKVISCNESKSFKMYNEGGNAKQCVTAFINKS